MGSQVTSPNRLSRRRRLPLGPVSRTGTRLGPSTDTLAQPPPPRLRMRQQTSAVQTTTPATRRGLYNLGPERTPRLMLPSKLRSPRYHQQLRSRRSTTRSP